MATQALALQLDSGAPQMTLRTKILGSASLVTDPRSGSYRHKLAAPIDADVLDPHLLLPLREGSWVMIGSSQEIHEQSNPHHRGTRDDPSREFAAAYATAGRGAHCLRCEI